MLQDFDARREHAVHRRELLDAVRAIEEEPSLMGASAHLIGVGYRVEEARADG
jgi:hypothetical protein